VDIYSFISSPVVAEHCKKIEHIFNPLETAVVIAISTRGIEEKHNAYREIISELHDMPIPESFNFRAKESLHDFLRELIAWEEKQVSWFYSTDEKSLYRPTSWPSSISESNLNRCFSTCDKALAAFEPITWDFRTNAASRFIGITKEFIDENYNIGAHFNDKKKLFRFYLCGDLPSIDDCPGYLDLIFIHMPVPFEKGDILMLNNGRPGVLVDLPHFGDDYKNFFTHEYIDGSDMATFHFYIDENGNLTHDHDPFYELQYYNAELLHGQELFLKYLSSCIKNNDTDKAMECLLSTYQHLKLKALAKRYDNILDRQNIESKR